MQDSDEEGKLCKESTFTRATDVAGKKQASF